ncbi:hypothetical protein D9M68_476470 [compost metagenome]
MPFTRIGSRPSAASRSSSRAWRVRSRKQSSRKQLRSVSPDGGKAAKSRRRISRLTPAATSGPSESASCARLAMKTSAHTRSAGGGDEGRTTSASRRSAGRQDASAARHRVPKGSSSVKNKAAISSPVERVPVDVRSEGMLRIAPFFDIRFRGADVSRVTSGCNCPPRAPAEGRSGPDRHAERRSARRGTVACAGGRGASSPRTPGLLSLLSFVKIIRGPRGPVRKKIGSSRS